MRTYPPANSSSSIRKIRCFVVIEHEDMSTHNMSPEKKSLSHVDEDDFIYVTPPRCPKPIVDSAQSAQSISESSGISTPMDMCSGGGNLDDPTHQSEARRTLTYGWADVTPLVVPAVLAHTINKKSKKKTKKSKVAKKAVNKSKKMTEESKSGKEAAE